MTTTIPETRESASLAANEMAIWVNTPHVQNFKDNHSAFWMAPVFVKPNNVSSVSTVHFQQMFQEKNEFQYVHEKSNPEHSMNKFFTSMTIRHKFFLRRKHWKAKPDL